MEGFEGPNCNKPYCLEQLCQHEGNCDLTGVVSQIRHITSHKVVLLLVRIKKNNYNFMMVYRIVGSFTDLVPLSVDGEEVVPKHWYLSTSLRGITSQKSAVLLINMRSWIKKCSLLMWHMLETVTAVDSDMLCNILKLLTRRQKAH
jgi:hypothetical protein